MWRLFVETGIFFNFNFNLIYYNLQTSREENKSLFRFTASVT